MKGSLFDIRRYSIHDGPGIRTTVFLKGCPLRCLWCHNPEGQRVASELLLREERCIHCAACIDACQNGAIQRVGEELVTDRDRCQACGECIEACYAEARQITGRWMSVAGVIEEIEKDRVFYDQSGGGVTFSGGEPLVQRDFLLACLMACRERSLHTALDTCGYAPWETLEAVRPYVDLFLYDLKLVDDDRHRRATGVGSNLILENLRCLAEHGSNLILRFPLIPGVNDDQENLQAIAAFAVSLPGLVRLDVLPYHHSSQGKYAALGRPYPLHGIRPPDPGRVEAAVRFFESCHLTVKLGG